MATAVDFEIEEDQVTNNRCLWQQRQQMSQVNRESWDIYNRAGEFQNRTILRGDPLNEGDFHLLVQIWVRNTKGNYLIQRRSENLTSLPGIWATTAGAVTAGEDSLTGAVRELEEELGIKALPHELQKLVETTSAKALGTAWLLEKDVSDDEITFQKEEVSAVRWATPETIRKMVAAGSFYDYGDAYFRAIFSSKIEAK